MDDQPIRGTRSHSNFLEMQCSCFELVGCRKQKLIKNGQMQWRRSWLMIEKNQTWKLVERPQDRKVIGVEWIFLNKVQSKWLGKQAQSKIGGERLCTSLGTGYFCPSSQIGYNSNVFGYNGIEKFEEFSNGREVCLLEWSTIGRNLC